MRPGGSGVGLRADFFAINFPPFLRNVGTQFHLQIDCAALPSSDDLIPTKLSLQRDLPLLSFLADTRESKSVGLRHEADTFVRRSRIHVRRSSFPRIPLKVVEKGTISPS